MFVLKSISIKFLKADLFVLFFAGDRLLTYLNRCLLIIHEIEYFLLQSVNKQHQRALLGQTMFVVMASVIRQEVHVHQEHF